MTPKADRAGPLALRCETALDQVSVRGSGRLRLQGCVPLPQVPTEGKKTPPMKTPSLGIDIAKLTFDAALRFDRQRCLKARFANNRSGFQQLYRWLKTHCAAGSALRVAVESTSTYAEALVEWLDAK